MSEKDEQIAVPYGKPDIIFEKRSDGRFHPVGCLRRYNKGNGPDDYRCSGKCFSMDCPFKEMSPEQVESDDRANPVRVINGKSLVEGILLKLRKK